MSAIMSECGNYRYLLSRPPLRPNNAYKSTALWIMLNPSTADAEIDDPTIRRCRSFADSWECTGIVVANLFALRSTDPEALLTTPDPIGPDNDSHLRGLAREYETVVFAWGSNAPQERANQVLHIFRDVPFKLCLGKNENGSPKHPLYISSSQPLIDF